MAIFVVAFQPATAREVLPEKVPRKLLRQDEGIPEALAETVRRYEAMRRLWRGDLALLADLLKWAEHFQREFNQLPRDSRERASRKEMRKLFERKKSKRTALLWPYDEKWYPALSDDDRLYLKLGYATAAAYYMHRLYGRGPGLGQQLLYWDTLNRLQPLAMEFGLTRKRYAMKTAEVVAGSILEDRFDRGLPTRTVDSGAAGVNLGLAHAALSLAATEMRSERAGAPRDASFALLRGVGGIVKALRFGAYRHQVYDVLEAPQIMAALRSEEPLVEWDREMVSYGDAVEGIIARRREAAVGFGKEDVPMDELFPAGEQLALAVGEGVLVERVRAEAEKEKTNAWSLAADNATQLVRKARGKETLDDLRVLQELERRYFTARFRQTVEPPRANELFQLYLDCGLPPHVRQDALDHPEAVSSGILTCQPVLNQLRNTVLVYKKLIRRTGNSDAAELSFDLGKELEPPAWQATATCIQEPDPEARLQGCFVAAELWRQVHDAYEQSVRRLRESLIPNFLHLSDAESGWGHLEALRRAEAILRDQGWDSEDELTPHLEDAGHLQVARDLLEERPPKRILAATELAYESVVRRGPRNEPDTDGEARDKMFLQFVTSLARLSRLMEAQGRKLEAAAYRHLFDETPETGLECYKTGLVAYRILGTEAALEHFSRAEELGVKSAQDAIRQLREGESLDVAPEGN